MAHKISGTSDDGRSFSFETDDSLLALQLAEKLFGIESKPSRRSKSPVKAFAAQSARGSKPIGDMEAKRLELVNDFAKSRRDPFGASDAADNLDDHEAFNGVSTRQVIQRLLRAHTGEGLTFRKVGKRWTTNSPLIETEEEQEDEINTVQLRMAAN